MKNLSKFEIFPKWNQLKENTSSVKYSMDDIENVFYRFSEKMYEYYDPYLDLGIEWNRSGDTVTCEPEIKDLETDFDYKSYTRNFLSNLAVVSEPDKINFSKSEIEYAIKDMYENGIFEENISFDKELAKLYAPIAMDVQKREGGKKLEIEVYLDGDAMDMDDSKIEIDSIWEEFKVALAKSKAKSLTRFS